MSLCVAPCADSQPQLKASFIYISDGSPDLHARTLDWSERGAAGVRGEKIGADDGKVWTGTLF